MKRNFAYWFHLFITVLSWAAPFLVDWRVVVGAYLIIWLQFRVFGRCLLNKAHGLDARGNYTFYAHLMEEVGLRPDHARVKKFVHGWLYIIFAAIAVGWQVWLGHRPVLF